MTENLLKNKLIIITEIADNILISLAHKYNAEIIEHNELIGGRYSVLTDVGMLPAFLMGLKNSNFKKDLRKLLHNKSIFLKSFKNIKKLNLSKTKTLILLIRSSGLESPGSIMKLLVPGEGLELNPLTAFPFVFVFNCVPEEISSNQFLRTPLCIFLIQLLLKTNNIWKVLIYERWFMFIFKTLRSLYRNDYYNKREKYIIKYNIRY